MTARAIQELPPPPTWWKRVEYTDKWTHRLMVDGENIGYFWFENKALVDPFRSLEIRRHVAREYGVPTTYMRFIPRVKKERVRT